MRSQPSRGVGPLGLAALVACASGSVACRRQAPALGGEGGPAVVLVDRADAGAAAAGLREREPNDTAAQALALPPDTPAAGTIGPAEGKRRDADCYRFEVEGAAAPDGGPARRSVRIEVSATPEADLVIEVLDRDGALVVAVDDGPPGGAEVVPALALGPGPYTVRIREAVARGRAPRAAESAPYSLGWSVRDLPPGEEAEPNDRPALASELAPGRDVTGRFGWRRDEDWLRLPLAGLPEGQALDLDLEGVEGVAPRLRVLDSIEQPIAEVRGGAGENLSLRRLALRPGESHYYVTVRAETGSSHDALWRLRAAVRPAAGAEIEPNDERAQASPLPPGPPLVGFLVPGDTDWYRVELPAAQVLRAEVTAPERVDVRLAAVDAAGGEIAVADEGGRREPERLVGLAAQGAAFFRISARKRDGNADEPYRLTVVAEPDDPRLEREPNPTPARATPVPADGVAAGYVQPRGDVDFWRLEAPATATRARLEARGVARVTLAVRALDEGGRTLAQADVAGLDAARTLDLPLDGGRTWFVRVADAGGKGANPRDRYRLTAFFE